MVDDHSKHQIDNFFAGGISGCSAKTAVAPLDRIKILRQSNIPMYSKGSMWQAFWNIPKYEGGWKAYFKGNGVQMVRIFPYAGVGLVTFDLSLVWSKKILGEQARSASLLAGAITGMSMVAFTYPLDIIRTRFAVQTTEQKYTSIIQSAQHMFKKEKGWKTMFRGLSPSLWGVIPYGGISFATFVNMKRFFIENDVKYTVKTQESGRKVLSGTGKGIAGTIAGLMAQTVSYPIDLARRRIQIDGFAYERNYGNFLQTIKAIYKTEGFKGLFTGMSINYIRVVPSITISYYVSEMIKESGVFDYLHGEASIVDDRSHAYKMKNKETEEPVKFG
jgi:solute carrier family 25 protein 16